MKPRTPISSSAMNDRNVIGISVRVGSTSRVTKTAQRKPGSPTAMKATRQP